MSAKQENSPDSENYTEQSEQPSQVESTEQKETTEVQEEDQEKASQSEELGRLIRQTWIGQYPHPDDLQKYEDIHKGFTDRLLNMTEAESEHRRGLEIQQVEAGINHFQRG